ncbi:MAG: polyphosphate:AMP phosphotransferase [candidate division NC10 bacterium]
MFEIAELGQTLSKEEFHAQELELRVALLDLQTRLKVTNASVLIIISGVDGAGKGETVNLLHEWFDPRFLQAMAFDKPSDEERSRPEYWRYWRKLPPRGRIGIFFGSWYTTPIVDRALKRKKKNAFARAMQRINATEKMLADDGVLIVKFWFHLSKQAQKRRLKRLEKDPETRWRVTDQDWENFTRYDWFREVSTEAVQATNTPEAPWVIVEGADANWRSLFVVKHLQAQLTTLLKHAENFRRPKPVPMTAPKKRPLTILDKLDLSLKAGKNVKEELAHWRAELNTVSRRAKQEQFSTVLVFEGMDAAGKGGAIRRITASLDARDYHIIPIAAPSSEERAQHYLWRFWRNMPPHGKITIFDRSWYGRLLVERVEGFATEPEWMRAPAEINAFEEQLTADGVILIKFWLHIDAAEQLRRFKDREATPYKQFKITEEDWRNREKLAQYAVAVNEMVEKTSTQFAPWTMVEANDKAYARIKVLRTMAERLREKLG